MSDVVIRGMDMPKTCCECDLKIYDPEKRWDENGIEQIGAWVCKKTREIIWNTQRCESCPLVPLPEGHGRLGDLDALEKELAFDYAYASAKVCHNAPTIVPAEGGTKDGA